MPLRTARDRHASSWRRLRTQAWRILALAAAGMMASCGGSPRTSAPPPTSNNPDFRLLVTAPSSTLTAGSTVPLTLAVQASGGFSSDVTVQAISLPPGMTLSDRTVTVSAGSSRVVTATLDSSAPPSRAAAVFSAASGTLTRQAAITLAVGGASAHASFTRTRYVRTDASTPYPGPINMLWILYEPVTQRFFVTDRSGNRIFVLDARTEAVIGSIVVPGAYTVDDSEDHKTIYVGTQMGDVYLIDPVSMSIRQRYSASQIGPIGFAAYEVLALTGGKLALLGGQGGIETVDGYTELAVWDPATNVLVNFGEASFGEPNGVCGGGLSYVGAFYRTPDRRRVLVGSVVSGGGICSFDPVTRASAYTETGTYPAQFVVTPDGQSVISYNYPKRLALVFDVKTMVPTATFPVDSRPLAVSPDSKILLTDGGSFGPIYAYDLSTHQVLGWISAPIVPSVIAGTVHSSTTLPILKAVDPTGLFAGPMEEGVGFVDLSKLQTGQPTQTSNAYLNPATGPANGGTAVQWGSFGLSAELPSVYFGDNAATGVSVGTYSLTATTPAGPPGPTDVSVMLANGSMQILPESFSYGPSILQVTTSFATTDGGGTGTILGYGFVPVNGTTPDLQVQVGGIRANIIGYSSNAYGVIGQPMPLQGAEFVIPPGVAGLADVVATTGAGSTIVPGAITYLDTPPRYPLPGASLIQGVYNRKTARYYFTDANAIQVFSADQRAWLSPIPVRGAIRLYGISVSPDGSKLAVSDSKQQRLSIIDLQSPPIVKTFPIPLSDPTGSLGGLAITDSSVLYFQASGFQLGLFKFDTTTGALKSYNTGFCSRDDNYLRVLVSADNKRVFYGLCGVAKMIDTTTDETTFAPMNGGYGGDYELTLASNQTRLEAGSYLYDSDLRAESYMTLNVRESFDTGYIYGAKLNADGSLLFQPTVAGIDVFDGHVGTLRARIALPFSLSVDYDALVSNGRDNSLLAIIAPGNSIAVVDLNSLPEPNPLPYADNAQSDHSSPRISVVKPPRLRSEQTGSNLPSRLPHHVTRAALTQSAPSP